MFSLNPPDFNLIIFEATVCIAAVLLYIVLKAACNILSAERLSICSIVIVRYF